MKTHPILFNGPMVRAILDGRKTQTRRVAKLTPCGQLITKRQEGYTYAAPLRKGVGPTWTKYDGAGNPDGECALPMTECVSPYGVPGSQLWVRETFSCLQDDQECVFYRATDHPDCGPWKPSIFMPRDFSRLALEICEVRVQQVQEISEEDAKAEGLKAISKDLQSTLKWGIPDRDGLPGTDDDGWPWQEFCKSPIEAYQKLWDSINGKSHPWSENPWVWVVSFRRVE